MSEPQTPGTPGGATAPPPAPAAQLPVQPAVRGLKSPFLAGLLSLFPGVGNIYNGLYMRGVAMFLAIAALIYLTAYREPFLGLGIAFMWIFNIIDAVRQATLINYARSGGVTLESAPAPRPGQGGLLTGIILFAIGLFALLDRFFYIDLDWLIDLWPVGFMALGAWIAWTALRDRRSRTPASEDDGEFPPESADDLEI